MSGRDVVDEAIARLRRREETGRWVVTASLSVLIHLAILLLLASTALDASTPVEAEPEEIVVPLELEQPEPQPQPEPAQPAPQPAPEQEPREQAEEQPSQSDELIGWRSQGDEPGRQDRPPGPEADVHGPPEPSEEQGTALEPSELEEAPPGPDELPQDPGEERSEERAGPADQAPEELEETPVDPEEQPDEAPPPEEPDTSRVEPQPPGELFPEPREVPDESPEAPRQPSETEREPEPEPLPLPTPPEPRPRQEPDRGGTRKQLPGFEAEIQGGYFNQNMKFDDKTYAWEEYATKLYFAVYRAWLRELHGRIRRFERDQTLHGLDRIEGQVAIHFTIHQDGGVSGLEVRDPSRLPALDEASSAALRRAVIPPLPDDYPKEQTGLTFSFELRGFPSAQALKYKLEWSRARGEF